MPRSSGGGRGQRNAAAIVASRKSLKSYLTGNSRSCQVVFDLYEECVKDEHLHHPGSCDSFREMKESCSQFKRDPRRQSVFERLKQWEESRQREATAAGFASVGEYIGHKYSEKSYLALCRISYRMYKECISRDPTDKTCDDHRRDDCRQFRS